MWQISTETKRKGTIALNKQLLFSFTDQTGQITYEFKMTANEFMMKVNGGDWVKVKNNQE